MPVHPIACDPSIHPSIPPTRAVRLELPALAAEAELDRVPVAGGQALHLLVRGPQRGEANLLCRQVHTNGSWSHNQCVRGEPHHVFCFASHQQQHPQTERTWEKSAKSRSANMGAWPSSSWQMSGSGV